MKLSEFPNVKKIYQWASEYTAENVFQKAIRIKDRIKDFYETDTFRRIMFKAVNQRRGLIGILGLQGSGKTRTLYELETILSQRLKEQKQNLFLLKWSKDVFEQMKTWAGVWDRYSSYAKGVVTDEFEFYSRAHKRHPKLGKIPTRDDLERVEKSELDYELFLSKGKIKELMKEAIYSELGNARYILIDMPDYTKSTAHSMNRDINNVQDLWQKLQADDKRQEISFIIAFQKEMVMKHPHFFIGKLDVVTLKPLKPEELIEAYKLRNETIEPFTEDTLRLIGELSRGIFRRFLKYIQITIEKNLESKIPLTVENVNNAITEDLLIEDMELELSDVFKAKDQKTQAVRVLNFLRQRGACNMKTIAEELNIGQKVVQRLIQKLYGYRYVDIKRGKGKEKLVSLKL